MRRKSPRKRSDFQHKPILSNAWPCVKYTIAKPLVWVGDAREQVQSFPKAVGSDIGAASYDVQLGEKPPKAKPFKGVGSGVLEIATRFETDTFRTVYAVKIGRRVYVLHAFQKKSPKGRKTATLDVEMITRRYKEAVNMEKEQA